MKKKLNFTLYGQSFNEEMEVMPTAFLELVSAYLETRDIDISPDIFKDSEVYNPDEIWEVPKEDDMEILIEMKGVTTKDLDVGWVAFGRYKGVPVVIEQNASPIMVYYNRALLNQQEK